MGDGKKYNISYKYDHNGNTVQKARDGEFPFTKENVYTVDNELQQTVYTVADQQLQYTYETDNTPDRRNAKVTLPFDVEQKFAYDGLGRTRQISLGDNLVKDLYYAKYGDHATSRVNSVWYGVNGVRKDNTKYTYDKAGNIATVTENGVVVARYVYDGLNRLVRENNSVMGKKTYEYDSAGNILCKATNGKRIKYRYAQNGWKDKLVSLTIDDIVYPFEYDELGNPILYRDEQMFWKGRRLMSYKGINYAYDANGIRTSKNRNGVTYNYVYDGNTLVAEQRTNGSESFWIYYLYGVDGIAGFRYNGETYLFRKNLQGDVTHIYTESGEQVGHYAYDAFGEVKVLQDKDGIATLNPFRYRSYYLDEETGLYYLQTRYYDPEIGRFISADGIEYIDPRTLGGLNLYAYCGNNPVMYVDPLGDFFLTALLVGLIAGGIAGAVTGGVVSYVNAKEAGSSGWDLFGQTLLGVLDGAFLGGAVGAVAGVAIGAGAGIFAAGASMFGTGLAGSSLALANGLVLGAGATVAAGFGIMVVGGGIVLGTATLIGNLVFSKNANRYKPKDQRSNTIQNKEFERIVKEYKLDKDQARRLHDRIMKKGFNRANIIEIMKRIFPWMF